MKKNLGEQYFPLKDVATAIMVRDHVDLETAVPQAIAEREAMMKMVDGKGLPVPQLMGDVKRIRKDWILVTPE